MATLGYNNTPNATEAIYRARVKAIYIGQMPEDGTLTNAHAYCDASLGDPQDFALGVYTSNASDYPDDALDSAATSATATAGWVSVSLAGSLSSGTHVWVAIAIHSTNGNNDFRLYRNSAGASVQVRQGDNPSAYPDLPTPWSNDDSWTVTEPSAYITYNAVNGGTKNLLAGKLEGFFAGKL